MRVPAVLAVLVLGLAGVTGAGAADLRRDNIAMRYGAPYDVVGHRTGQLIIYDYEPGVVVRAYWLPPWRNRHYFPFHRDAVKARAAVRPRPAERYRRTWSNGWIFTDEFSPEKDNFKSATPHEPVAP